jgi:heptaprenyl diphosphate synthase
MTLTETHSAVPHIHDTTSQAHFVSTSLSDIFQRAHLSDDLAAIEQRMIERLSSGSQIIAEAGKHILGAGGKRLRAALVLLAARFGNYNLDHASHPAIAVELLHAASLIHDDLVDNAGQRRCRKTVHALWDKDVALMLGVFLFGLASHELANEPDARVIRFYVAASQTMVEGELSPVTVLEPLDKALGQYWRKIGAKTAVLFEAACKAGIAVTGGTPEQIEALGRFGYDLGMAFQIVDDVLDFTGDEALLGKPAGNDLREGTLTLPLIYATANSKVPLLRDLARTARPDLGRIRQTIDAVLAAGGDTHALADARDLVERARSHLLIFPHSPNRRALFEVSEFVLNRKQ